MQDLLTIAAELTATVFLASVTIAPLLYAWNRTAPIPAPVAAIPTPAATVEPIPEIPAVAPIAEIPVVPEILTIAPSNVDRQTASTQPRRKRGRPRKYAA